MRRPSYYAQWEMRSEKPTNHEKFVVWIEPGLSRDPNVRRLQVQQSTR